MFSLTNVRQHCISVWFLMLLIAYSCPSRVCGCIVIFPERDKNQQIELKQNISTDTNVLFKIPTSAFFNTFSMRSASIFIVCISMMSSRIERQSRKICCRCGTPILMQFLRPAACLCYSWFTALHAREVAAQSHGEKMVLLFVFKHTALLGRNVVCAFD